MCGICGASNFSEPDAGALVRRMTDTMVHRGPDDEGYLDDGPLALGMRRLSIIDLEGGHQPIFNEDGSIGVVLNGEIYNFRSLRKRLEDRGHSFRTRSDSEVIAHAYEEWGADSVQHLEGMFAFAVWDRRGAKGQEQRGKSEERRGTLFLARDRLGIKPFYYYAGKEQSAKSKEQRAEGEDPFSDSDGPLPLALGPLPGSQFLFASEVRTLLASGVVPRRLSRSALRSYLLFGSVSEPETLVEGVFSLPPGHTLTIRLDGHGATPKPEPYWNIASGGKEQRAKRQEQPAVRIATETQRHGGAGGAPMRAGETSAVPVNSQSEIRNAGSPDGQPGWGASSQSSLTPSPFAPGSLRFAQARVRELLSESVRQHLIADVPIGVFLSSGIDSTALAALASREVSGIHTFTVAFPEKEFSEAAIARQTAKQFGTTHDELMLSGDEMLARLTEAVGALDQPSIDGINTYFVSWAARQAGLKVTLSGLGGDEVFGGYNTFRRTPQYQRLAAIGSQVPRSLRAAMAAALSSAGSGLARGDAARKLAALWNDSSSLPHAYFFARALFTPSQVAELLNETQRPDNLLWWDWLAEGAEQTSKMDNFSAVTCLEARSYLVSTLLRDTDSMSMAHSLEVRVPFLHHPLVEFVTQLPAEMKQRNGTPKALLVAALSDLLPSEVIHQTKRGFTFPWEQWLRGPLREMIDSGLASLSPSLRDAVNEKSAYAVWQSYLNGKTSWSRPWSLYVLNEWVKRHLD
jgi:asparagine synthase (glutamine-hydrolysing)